MKPVRCRVGPPIPQSCSIVAWEGGRSVTVRHGARSAVPTRGVVGEHGGSDAVDQSIRRGRLCPPYRLRVVSKAAYDSNFGNAGLAGVRRLVAGFVNGRLARDDVTL
jgi:hypothetical protein